MIDLQSLGFTKEELQERVIDQLCRQVLSGTVCDEYGNEIDTSSVFSKKLNELVKKKIDETINAIAEKHVLPNVASYIENLTITETNSWGEAKKAPVTFIEYLTQRAEAYMQEKVDNDGKSKGESSFWNGGKQTRITYLIHHHLQYSIETAMKDALKTATGEIARGIHETARLKLNEIAASMKVSVTA